MSPMPETVAFPQASAESATLLSHQARNFPSVNPGALRMQRAGQGSIVTMSIPKILCLPAVLTRRLNTPELSGNTLLALG